MAPIPSVLLLATIGLPAARAGAFMGGAPGDGVHVLQPDSRGAAHPDRAFDLQRMDLELDLQVAARSVEGTVTLTLARLWEGPLILDQVELDIASVTGPDGPVPWRTEGRTLIIDVDEAFGVTEPQAVRVAYRATPRTGLHFREAGRGSPDDYPEVWSQGEGTDNRHWLPTWDHPNDRFEYHGTVRGPEGWEVLTNSGHDMVSYLVMIAAGPYEIVAHPDDPEVTVWLPPGTDREALHRVLDPVPAMKAHMGERAGVAYPWGAYRQVFVQRFMYTGMENTSATINHERLLVDDSQADTFEGAESVVAHELAHQWYGDLLTCEGWRELWLNEGFATFIAADWMAQSRPESWYARRARGWLQGASNSPRPMAGRFFHGPDAAPNHNVYGRGAAVLHMLRVHLGEERFWAGVQRYTQQHSYQLVRTEDLQAAMEAVSGRNLDWFFQQWVELGHVPDLAVSSRFEPGDEEAPGALRVVVRQRIDTDEPTYTLPVTVEVGTAEGETLRRSGWLEDEELTLSVELDAAPRYVAFDPDGAFLATREHTQDAAAWEAQLSSPSALARLDAIAALGELDAPTALAALLADTEAAPAERVAAAAALGAQRQSPPLLAALDDAHGAVRQAAAQALAGSVDRTPADALRRLVRRDSDDRVRAAALRSLARVDTDMGLATARGLLGPRVDREGQVLWGAAAHVVGEHGEPVDLDRLLASGLPARLAHDGSRAAARIAAREEGARRTGLEARVARYVEPLLDDLDLRGRQHAVGLLREVGDVDSVDRLEAYRRAETVVSLQDAARSAVDRIRARQGKPARPAPEGAQEVLLERLEERLGELEEQLDRLQDRH